MGRTRCEWYKSIDVRRCHGRVCYLLVEDSFHGHGRAMASPPTISACSCGTVASRLAIGWARTVNRRAAGVFQLDEASIRGAQAMVRLPAPYSAGGSPLPPWRTLGLPDLLWPGLSA